MPYKTLYLGNSVFLFFRNADEKIEVVRAEWTPGFPLRSDPKYMESKVFDSEHHLEVELMSKLFDVEVTQ